MKNKKNENYISACVKDGVLYELIYDETTQTTSFVYLERDLPQYTQSVDLNGREAKPYPANNNLIQNRAILLPSQPQEYHDEQQLLSDISDFVHTYLEVSEGFKKIINYYVLLSWIYDKFKEIPYLRAIGDFGCGKSRFLKVVGSVCYKPMFTPGATTTAPIFRIISQFRGTLILDEADMRFSDTNHEMVKILNNGFQDDIPILRCSGDDFEVKAYNVFGPKIVATRNKFADKALESRFLIEFMDGVLTRTDIPFNLDTSFDEAALKIRNKCLMWRLRHHHKNLKASAEHDPNLEPRLNQIVAPLIAIVNDEKAKSDIREFVRKHGEELKVDRGMSFEAPILEIVVYLMDSGSGDVTVKSIADKYNMLCDKVEKDLSPRKVGTIIRNKFQFKTEKTRDGYVLERNSYQKNIDRLCGKYGIKREHVNDVKVGSDGGEDFVKELEGMGLIKPDLPSFN